MKIKPSFTLIEIVVSIGLFMVAVTVALVATVGTNSLVSRTDARSSITESARSVTDTMRRIASNAPVGAVDLQGYYTNPDAFAGVRIEAFSTAQNRNTCEVVGRAKAAVDASNQELYTIDTTGDTIAYWVYKVDSALQCPDLATMPIYQNRLSSKQVKVTNFQAQLNSYDCDPSANCATKQQLRYSFTLELTLQQSGRAQETKTSSTTVTSALPIGLIGTGIIPVNIATTAMPNGTVDEPYSKEIIGEGGKLPYSWSHTGNLGSFPNLTLTQQGNKYVLQGTPTVAGTVSITVTLRDSTNPQLVDVQDLTFEIAAGGGGGGGGGGGEEGGGEEGGEEAPPPGPPGPT
ncbi:MAG: hypothetical protein HZB70_03470 [Candidatus Berkelbacteria bacterium]|nr:MAG: hypothetical protein HZB70_03470 [Candidatus Berkelbacteria bacterium]QQG51638.1 MAG: hypothetical protein HY845_03720 [Candidatus Berkelbacteria bacterium]